jgi:hypothetical protein
VRELDYQCEIMDRMGLDQNSVMIVHMGVCPSLALWRLFIPDILLEREGCLRRQGFSIGTIQTELSREAQRESKTKIGP